MTRTIARCLCKEVWPPGSANTLCPRPPLMTQAQYFISWIKKRQRWDVQTYRRCELMTLTFNLGGHGACRWSGSTSSVRIPTLKLIDLTVRKIWHILYVCVSRPVTLIFDLLTSKLVRNVARAIWFPPANFVDTTTSPIRFRFMGHYANTA